MRKHINEYWFPKYGKNPWADLKLVNKSAFTFNKPPEFLQDLVVMYIYDLKDGLALKYNAAQDNGTDPYWGEYELFTDKDLMWYTELKGWDLELPSWIKSVTFRLYKKGQELWKDAEGFIHLPVKNNKEVQYIPEEGKVVLNPVSICPTDKQSAKAILIHEFQHCWDFCKDMKRNNTSNMDYLIDTNDDEGDWKDAGDLDIQDSMSVWGTKSNRYIYEFLDNYDPDEWRKIQSDSNYVKAMKILTETGLDGWMNNINEYVFQWVIYNIFYFIDYSEGKAYLAPMRYKDIPGNYINKHTKLYRNIYNIIKNFENISEDLIYNLAEKYIIDKDSDYEFITLLAFIQDVINVPFRPGIKNIKDEETFYNSFINWLKEIKDELFPQIENVISLL